MLCLPFLDHGVLSPLLQRADQTCFDRALKMMVHFSFFLFRSATDCETVSEQPVGAAEERLLEVAFV